MTTFLFEAHLLFAVIILVQEGVSLRRYRMQLAYSFSLTERLIQAEYPELTADIINATLQWSPKPQRPPPKD